MAVVEGSDEEEILKGIRGLDSRKRSWVTGVAVFSAFKLISSSDVDSVEENLERRPMVASFGNPIKVPLDTRFESESSGSINREKQNVAVE